jgi:hypothetical protein
LRFRAFESSCFGVRHLSRGSRGRTLEPFVAIECDRVGNSLTTGVLVEYATSPPGDLSRQPEVHIDHGRPPPR